MKEIIRKLLVLSLVIALFLGCVYFNAWIILTIGNDIPSSSSIGVFFMMLAIIGLTKVIAIYVSNKFY